MFGVFAVSGIGEVCVHTSFGTLGDGYVRLLAPFAPLAAIYVLARLANGCA